MQMASLAQRKGHIQVDQIRPLGQLTHLSAHAGGRRVVLLYTAEALTISAANALLKTLEEPPEGVYFILLSHHPARVLPTIRSRCRLFPLQAPSHQQALDWLNGQQISHPERWLRFLQGAPLQLAGQDWTMLFNQLEDILQHLSAPKQLNIMDSALRWEKYPLAFWLEVLQKWLLDIAQMQMVGSVRYFVEYESNVQGLATQAQTRVLWMVMDELIEATRWIQHPLSVRLLLEKCLIRYTEIFVTPARL
jgi:DNA polymerase-3 subunit delta'